jgi:hypothetical protein
MKSVTNNRRWYWIRSCYAILDVATLGVIVLIVYAVGLPALVAVTVVACLTGIVLTIIHRWLLPKPPPISDEERLQLPKLRPVWLPVGLMGFGLFYFVAHMRLAIAGILIVPSISALIIGEMSTRRKAKSVCQAATKCEDGA